MMSLYAERRAVRKAVTKFKKQLRKQNPKIKESEVAAKVEEYQATLDPKAVIQEQDTKLDGMTVIDALAASGLRSMRYWKELEGRVKHITINDLDPAAVERAHSNLQENNLHDVLLESNRDRDYGICIQTGDATHELYMSRRPQQMKPSTSNPTQMEQKPMWDVIDLDPYGSAAPFIDGAVQAVENGGLLCLTCTDMAALGGSHPETAFGRYAGLPIQSARYLQEAALRILLHTIAVSAARYGRTIRPVLSVGMAFYVRVFVEVNNDKKGVSDLSLNIGHVYQSTKCPSFHVLPHGVMGGKKQNVYQSIRLNPGVCEETGSAFKVGGPMWLGPLHDKEVLKTALERLDAADGAESPDMKFIATKDRLKGLLTSCLDELDTPLYYQLPTLCQAVGISCMPLQQFMAGIHNAGYQVSGYHKEPQAIKTNAPNSVVWDVIRAAAKKTPPKKPAQEGSPAWMIMSKEPSIAVDFTVPKSFKRNSRSDVKRFPMNPSKFWGPKQAATGHKRKADEKGSAAGEGGDVEGQSSKKR